MIAFIIVLVTAVFMAIGFVFVVMPLLLLLLAFLLFFVADCVLVLV